MLLLLIKHARRHSNEEIYNEVKEVRSMSLIDRFSNAWNAFFGLNGPPKGEKQYISQPYIDYGYMSSYRPDRINFNKRVERSIVTTIYNRIAIDCSSIDIKHVREDSQGRFSEEMNTRLNECLTLSANKDQTSRAFIQDVVMSLFDEGCVAIVPIDTSVDPNDTDSYDILSMRVAKIKAWYPDYIKVEVYNDRTGKFEGITVQKRTVAIVENPLYAIMNEKNSTLQRLLSKLYLLDDIDSKSNGGKLDLIIQLPYVIKTESRQKQAESRRADIEKQLSESKYGIAYTDGTEKITQLNRPVENNLLEQIKYLTGELYSQLGITDAVLNGTADEKTMMNYMNRTVEPVISAITDEMERKFLSQTARTQGQAIDYFMNPFRLIPMSNLADIADKFTRNEIMTPNEIRQIIGMKPVEDGKSDELRNRNISSDDNSQPDQSNNETDNSNLGDLDYGKGGILPDE